MRENICKRKKWNKFNSTYNNNNNNNDNIGRNGWDYVVNANIIQKANEAVNETQIASERMIIEQANAIVVAANKGGKATTEGLQGAINDVGNGYTATVMGSGDIIVIKFNESQRYYVIDNGGKISGPEKLIKDEHPGDITKGGTYDGSDEEPYEISCIEDLVAFSKLINTMK